MASVYTWQYKCQEEAEGVSKRSCTVEHLVELEDRPIKDISAGSSTTAILTEDGELLVLGESVISSKTLAPGSKVEGVSCRADNIAFYTSKNQIWAQGYYLRQGNKPAVVHTFDKKVKIKQIACGSTHCLVLTDQGIYSWGQNSQGQLGNAKRSIMMMQFLWNLNQVPSLQHKNVIQIACGGHHSLALTDAGEVYAFGANGYGQLGTGNKAFQMAPTLASELVGKHITFIAAGAAHSVAISKDGKAYLFGRTESGQCNTKAPENACLVPVEVALNDEVFVSAAASYSCTYLVTASGKIFDFGVLLPGEQETNSMDFRSPNGPFSSHIAQKVCCGHYHAVGVFGEMRVKISPSTLLANIQTALSDTLHTDLTLVTAHTTRQVHYVIVSLFCDVIASSSRANKSVVDLHDELKDLTLPLEEALIKYCYGISSELKGDEIKTLREVAIKLKFPSLVNDCETMSTSTDEMVQLVPTFNLSDALGKTFRAQDEHSSDVTFTFNNCQKKLHAHKIILATRCEYFHGLFSLGMKESKQDAMHIDEWSCEAFESMLYFLYSDELSVTGEHAAELLHIATRYLIQRLSDKCEEFIVDNMTLDNVVELYQLSEAMNATQIARGCHFFVRREVKRKDITKLRNFDKLTVEQQERLKMLLQGNNAKDNIQKEEDLPAITNNNNDTNFNNENNNSDKKCLIS